LQLGNLDVIASRSTGVKKGGGKWDSKLQGAGKQKKRFRRLGAAKTRLRVAVVASTKEMNPFKEQERHLPVEVRDWG